MSGDVDEQTHSADSDHQSGRTGPEWVTLAIATAIVLAVVGLIIYAWLSAPDQPPIMRVRQEAVREEDDLFYVPFVVENVGYEAVEAVQITAELWIGDEMTEQGEQTVDFLSGGETGEGAFIFSHDPTQGRLVLRVASYKVP